jgi:hypothetical protein
MFGFHSVGLEAALGVGSYCDIRNARGLFFRGVAYSGPVISVEERGDAYFSIGAWKQNNSGAGVVIVP